MVERIRNRGKYLLCILLMNILKLFWLFPVNKFRILFISFDGNQFSDNPKYLSDYLNRFYTEFSLWWAFKDCSKFAYLEYENYQLVNISSFAFLYVLATSKVVITNNFLPSYLPIRKSQIVLNTWHGGSPLKTVGLADEGTTGYDLYFFKMQGKKYNAFISSSEFMTEDVFRKSFDYQGLILDYGMPRNSILLSPHEEKVNYVYEHYHLKRDENTGIILYAPTFRGKGNSISFLPIDEQLDINNCLSNLEKRFNKKFYFLFRAHYAMDAEINNEKAILATDYPDMQELLCAADILITDYSSCMGDMALMRKPVFLYAPDIKEYIRDRGFYWDIFTLPFPIAQSKEQFANIIMKFDEETYAAGVEDYLNKLGSYDNAESVEKACKWILRKLDMTSF